MAEFVDVIVRIAGEHRAWFYALAFLVTLAEALPVVGALVPAALVMIALAALVPGGMLAPWPLLVWSTFGASAGGGVAYWLGRRHRDGLIYLWPFRRHRDPIAKAESLVRTRGAVAVFSARFARGAVAFAALAAGSLGISPYRFAVVNVLATSIRASASLLAGVLLGASILLAGAVSGRLAVLLVFGVVIVGLTAVVARGAVRLVPLACRAFQERAFAWARAGNGWAYRQVAGLLDPARPGTRPLVVAAVVLTGAAWLFLGVLEDVVTGDPLVRVDAAVYRFLQGLRMPWTDRVLIAITELGDRAVVAPLAAAGFLWLVLRRAWRAAAYWAGGLAFASAFGTVLKLILHVPRPAAIYEGWSAYAFPSGHAIMSVVLWGLLSVFVAREAKPKWWPWIFGASATIVSLIAFSRLYLGAHWLSDVVGGLTFGIAWVALLSIAYLRRRPRRIGAQALAAVVVTVLAGAGFVHVYEKLPDDLGRYAARSKPTVVALAAWRGGQWRDLPAGRVDLGDEDGEPLTIQWVGDPGRLMDELLQSGWRVPAAWSPGNALLYIGPRAAALDLPVLPRVHDGRLPVLTLIRASDGSVAGASRLVLRVWDSGVRVTDSEGARRSLWIGEAVAETLSTIFPFLGVARPLTDVDGPLDALTRSLSTDEFVLRRRGPEETWNGRLLLGGWSDEGAG